MRIRSYRLLTLLCQVLYTWLCDLFDALSGPHQVALRAMVPAFHGQPRFRARLSMARLESPDARRTGARCQVHSAVPTRRMGARAGPSAKGLLASRLLRRPL